MAEATIDTLSIEINSNAGKAVGGIEALTGSLNRLKAATKGGFSLTKTNNQLKTLSATSKELGAVDVRMAKVVTALNSLGTIKSASGLKSTMTQLKKLPEITNSLDDKTIDLFTNKIEKLSKALLPLANRMDRVSRGFQMMPRNIGRTIRNVDRANNSYKRNGLFFTELWHKYQFVRGAMMGVTRVISGAIQQANAYIEDMNLFNVAMGKYADEAQNYAWKVGELLGIDPREWMRNQGVFMTITEGFGVASDRAYTMSKNLTQLGYDLSSFYNISFEDAMTKLTSGISGELEPLRRLGYDLSVARLQQEAYTLGINKSVNAMTQAEKAQLRYYAIMTQVTTSHGDMARTIQAPANQLRIFKAQVIQLARALGNILVPVLNIVLPYVVAFTKVLRELLETVARLFHIELPEFDLSDVVRTKKEMQGIGAGADDTAKGIGNAAKKMKELKNATLGIDELNIISPPEPDSGSGGRGGAGDGIGIDSGLDFPLPEYDFLKGLEPKGDEIVDKVKKILGVLDAIVMGSLFTVGVVMCILGHPGYGIAMMIAGLTGMVAMTINSSKLPNVVKKALAQVMAIVGGMSLALGAFLISSGSLAIGVALVVAGAEMLVSAVTLNFSLAKGKVKQFLITLMQAASGALLVFGICLLWVQQTIPLAIALIAAGAVGLVASTSLNFNAVTNKIKSFLKEAGGAIGTALLTIGVVITMSGAGLPVGIGLILAGVAGMVSQVALNWNAVKMKITSVLDELGYVISGAFLAIGMILIASGVGLPIGIAMLLMGAVSLVATVAVKWDTIKSIIAPKLEELKGIIALATLVIGTVLAFSGAGLPIGLALLAAGAVGIVTAAVINWDTLKVKVTEILKDLGFKIGASLLVLGVILAFTGVGLPIAIGCILAGVTSIVAAVVLNWDTIKDKIKEIFENIKSVAGTLGLIALGLMLCFTGVGIPLGMSLIKKGASQFGTGETISWDSMVNKLKEKLEEMKKKLRKWEAEFKANPVKTAISLAKSGWSSFKGWLDYQIGKHPSVSVAVDFVKGIVGDFGDATADLMDFLGFSETGGIITPYGIQQFAGGGFGRYGKMSSWNGIPTYGRGGKTHGSMFVAGENGAELVGHVGGQTEVLNRSQIATVMLNSTIQGMAQFLPVWNGIYAQVSAMRDEKLADGMIYSGASYKQEDDGYTLRQFAEEFMPLMRSTENSARTQADKDENITVRVGAREINNEIVRQNKANGFAFAE